MTITSEIAPEIAQEFVRLLRPVGIIDMSAQPSRGRDSTVIVGVTYRQDFAPMSEHDGPRPCEKLAVYVQRRADGTLFGKCMWVGHPWVCDWCRPCVDGWDNHILDCPCYTCDVDDECDTLPDQEDAVQNPWPWPHGKAHALAHSQWRSNWLAARRTFNKFSRPVRFGECIGPVAPFCLGASK